MGEGGATQDERGECGEVQSEGKDDEGEGAEGSSVDGEMVRKVVMGQVVKERGEVDIKDEGGKCENESEGDKR